MASGNGNGNGKSRLATEGLLLLIALLFGGLLGNFFTWKSAKDLVTPVQVNVDSLERQVAAVQGQMLVLESRQTTNASLIAQNKTEILDEVRRLSAQVERLADELYRRRAADYMQKDSTARGGGS